MWHALSLTMKLFHMSNQEKFTPVKYFSIDRVFRNETLDATHLAEFHQIEGVVADYGLTLGDLMGILHQFFIKLGQEGCGVNEQQFRIQLNDFIVRPVLLSPDCVSRWMQKRPPNSHCPSCFQGLPSYALSLPTTRTQSPAWRCSATTKV